MICHTSSFHQLYHQDQLASSTKPSHYFVWMQTEHLRQADPEMAAAVERAMAGRACEGGGAGGLLPEGLIATEPEAAATPLQPTPTEVWHLQATRRCTVAYHCA